MKASRLVSIASDVVAATQRELPREILEVAKRVPVRFEPAPSAELVAEGIEADSLGLFSGTPHGSPDSGGDPARIHLFTANLWDFAEEDEEAYREEARLTYLHELGHYLGWDEDQLAARAWIDTPKASKAAGTSANPRFPSRHHPVLTNSP